MGANTTEDEVSVSGNSPMTAVSSSRHSAQHDTAFVSRQSYTSQGNHSDPMVGAVAKAKATTNDIKNIETESDPAVNGIAPSATTNNTIHSGTKVSDPSGHREITEFPCSHSAVSNYNRGWGRVVRNFTPSWFSATMGTGIVSALLITIPFQAAWLYWLSVVFFALNSLLFMAAFTVSFLCYTLYPKIWTAMIRDPSQSLSLSTIPMGFATLIQSWFLLCCPHWGCWSVYLGWVAWMVDSATAVAITLSLTFLVMIDSDQNHLERFNGAQVLPISATIVASSAGVEAAKMLAGIGHLEQALRTLVISYVMWGISTPFAMMVMVIYYQRLALHKLPSKEVIVSSFLPVGPMGMGGFTILHAGRVAKEILPKLDVLSDAPAAGDILYVAGFLTSLVMWGFGIVWIVFAVGAIWSRRRFPFNMGWWSFTFPLGVFAVSTIFFGVQMPSMFFKVLGTIFAVAVILLWCVVTVATAKDAWTGKLFHAPCLCYCPKRSRNHMDDARRNETENMPSEVPGVANLGESLSNTDDNAICSQSQ